MQLVNWLNGKKTFLGLTALAFYQTGVFAGWWTSDPIVLAWIAGWTGVGLAHKALKA